MNQQLNPRHRRTTIDPAEIQRIGAIITNSINQDFIDKLIADKGNIVFPNIGSPTTHHPRQN
jgi:hypothetical protein